MLGPIRFTSASALDRVRCYRLIYPPFLVVYLDDLTSSCSSLRGLYIVLYDDDILLIAPSMCGLQNLLRICEDELIKVNTRKSSCLRIGPRHNNRCLSPIIMPWTNT